MSRSLFATVFVLSIILGPVLATSATLNPPWKCIENKNNFEYWYDTSTVKKSAKYIDVDVWEVYVDSVSATYKHIRFERPSGSRGYGECRQYQNNNKISEFDFSKMGYVFAKPQPVELKLFKILNK